MVIQMQFGIGDDIVKKRTYRDVIKGVNFAQYCEGFFANRTSYQWGKLIQLKGDERTVLRKFGKVPEIHG